MKIIICLDYSDHTERILEAAKLVLGTRVPKPEIRVVHIIDETVLSETTENEGMVMAQLKENGNKVYKLAKQYLGDDFTYIEETGNPREKISEILNTIPCDLLIIGTQGKSAVANILSGSIAEYLMHHGKKPIMIVP